MTSNWLSKISILFNLVQFKHSLFALPFALAMTFYATNGSPTATQILLIVLCMVFARNAAMSFNRCVDATIDAKNPRTAHREIPSQKISLKLASLFCAINAILFIVTSSYFNNLTLILSPFALIIILSYSLTKRFTHYTQFFLGLSLALAPMATYMALTETLPLFAISVSIGVLFWVFGFDLIYSTLDYEFDKAHGLKNMVVKWGLGRSLWFAKGLHGLSFVFFMLAGVVGQRGLFYFGGVLFMSLFLFYQHTLVKPTDLTRVNTAFFTLNGLVSFVFLIGSLLDIFARHDLPCLFCAA